MTAKSVRRDGLREAVTKLRDELLEKVEEIDRAEVNGTIGDGEWHERDAVSMIVDALSRLLDAVPDVPPDPPAVDREALLVLLGSVEIATDEHGDGATLQERPARVLADALLSSGVLVAADDVRARALEDAANESMRLVEQPANGAMWRKFLRDRAVSEREGDGSDG